MEASQRGVPQCQSIKKQRYEMVGYYPMGDSEKLEKILGGNCCELL